MNRRHFLTGSVGAAGAAALSPFAETRAQFAAALDSQHPRATLDDYTLSPGLTYFNHGSVGTTPRIVQEAHAKYLATCETNPWLYMWGGAWEEARESTRKQAGDFLGCEASEIVINRNTTDGFNLLAAGLPLKRGDEVLFSNFNHAGASICWQHRAGERGFVVRHLEIPFGEIGEMPEAAIVDRHRRAITQRTRVLVLPHMDNTLGLLTPIRAIVKVAREKGVDYVFADGAQVVGMLPVDVRALGVDAYCMSPHKWLQAPKGIGLMYMKKDLQERVRPQTVTWGQKRWSDSRVFEDYGTRDVPALLALGDAIAFHAKAGIEKTAKVRHELWRKVRAKVKADDRIIWRSPAKWELGGSLYAIEVKGKESSKLGEALWKKHKMVVRAFHSDRLNTLRLSPNVANTEAQIDAFFETLVKL